MKYDIFENLEDKANARTSLPELAKHPGWKYIVRTLETNIAYLTDQLKESEFADLLEVKIKQRQITHLEELKDLPETIVAAAQIEPEEEEDSEVY